MCTQVGKSFLNGHKITILNDKISKFKNRIFIKHQREGIHNPQSEEEMVLIHDLIGIKQMYTEVKTLKSQ